MTKILLAAMIVGVVSCGDASSTNNETSKDGPEAIDTTAHPDGVINGSVISTDTAAMRPSDTPVQR